MQMLLTLSLDHMCMDKGDKGCKGDKRGEGDQGDKGDSQTQSSIYTTIGK